MRFFFIAGFSTHFSFLFRFVLDSVCRFNVLRLDACVDGGQMTILC